MGVPRKSVPRTGARYASPPCNAPQSSSGQSRSASRICASGRVRQPVARVAAAEPNIKTIAKSAYEGTTAKLTATACAMGRPVVHASSDSHTARTGKHGEAAHDRLDDQERCHGPGDTRAPGDGSRAPGSARAPGLRRRGSHRNTLVSHFTGVGSRRHGSANTHMTPAAVGNPRVRPTAHRTGCCRCGTRPHREVLPAVDLEGHRGPRDVAVQPGLPEHGAGIGVEREEAPFGVAAEHEPARPSTGPPRSSPLRRGNDAPTPAAR